MPKPPTAASSSQRPDPTLSLGLLKDLCSQPTAPFAERQVVRWVEGFCLRRSLHLSRDHAGNLLVATGPAPRPGQRRLVLAAHMDHPGFVSQEQDGRTLRAFFRGGVLSSYLLKSGGSRVRFFTPSGEVLARVESVTDESAERPYPTSAVLTVAGPGAVVPPGSIGMFDLPAARFAPLKSTKTQVFQSRVCDDLAGAAAALSALDHLRHLKPKTPLAVLLTRAEEVGFIGAIAAVLDTHRPLLRKKDDLLLAIECSAEQPYARQHDGVILRVGDRTSIFNSSLSAFLHDTAAALAREDPTFKFQRALMPGGTCESTVYDAYGFHAAAVCLPLGNYHNMDRNRQRIAPEFVSTSDYLHMVRLFLRLAEVSHTYKPGHAALKARLEARFKLLSPLLITATTVMPPAPRHHATAQPKRRKSP